MAVQNASIRLTASDETARAFNSVRQSMSLLQGQARTVGTAFNTLGAGVRAFTGAFVGGFAVSQIIQVSDAYKNVETQLSNAVRTANELTTAQSRIFEIAQKTRQSYTALASTYAQISRTAGSSIGTQGEQLQFFDTLSKLVALSGVSAEQAANGLTQLRQGLGAGALRGEEFNSVMENTSRVGYAIAEGLGVGIDELRKMAERGELTAAKIKEALGSVAATVDEEFAKIIPTVDASLTKIGNSFGRMIERIEKETGGPLLELGRTLSWLADQMDRLSATPTLADKVDELKQLNENIAKYEKAGDKNKFASAQAAKLRAERDKLLAQVREQSRLVFREGENQSQQADLDRTRVAGEKANAAWAKLAATYASNAEKAKKAADEIRKAGEAAGKSEVEIQKMIAASNARFAKSGAKKTQVGTDPLFDIIGASEEREKLRQSQAEESILLLEQQERAGEQFERAELDRLRRVAEGWRDATDATRKFVEQYEEVSAAVALGPAAGGMTSEQGALARFLIGNELDGLGTVKAAIKEVDELTLQAARNIQDQIGQGLVDIMDGNFESIGKSFGDMLKRMVAEALAADLGRALMGNFAKTGELGGIFGAIFGGTRALGGPVSAGSAYLVGEKGPEMFVPSMSGQIVPNGAGVSVIQNISVGGGASRSEVAAAMSIAKDTAKREILESMRRGGVFA